MEGTNRFELTRLQYANIVPKQILRMYIYGRDHKHSGAILIATDGERYRKTGYLSAMDAASMEMMARSQGFEVRITDPGDMLVFHSKDGEILYPQGITGGEFWSKL